jgi:tagaturonate reductase
MDLCYKIETVFMQLSKKTLPEIASTVVDTPQSSIMDLPEKVLQFGTGVLLRALPDHFIDQANKKGIFNGRIVVVKSTDGDSSGFDRQDGLYTICVRGTKDGKDVEQNIINASISRVLGAKSEWRKILDCAHNPAMNIVISNTTEVGIQLVQDDINAEPPVSFPGKLLAFLFERYKAFDGSTESGMVIVPTELITDNGSKLESIVLELAHRNGLDYKFIEWLETHNTFCNSLVDRIVPGKPNAEETKKLESLLGYSDELLTMSEVFRLWAIEGDEKVKEVLSFNKIDEAVVIAPDITLFKELKLRLLNGTHSFNCGLAYLSGFDITREAVTDPVFSVFAQKLMKREIAGAIPYSIDEKLKEEFASNTFERFCNPFINHQWLSITSQYTSKMKMRNVPLLKRHYELNDTPPLRMATGFAGFLLYMKATRKEGDKYFGERNGKPYEIKDEAAGYFYEAWQQFNSDQLAEKVMQHEEFWEMDLATLPGFLQTVQEQLQDMMKNGVLNTIAQLDAKTVTAE